MLIIGHSTLELESLPSHEVTHVDYAINNYFLSNKELDCLSLIVQFAKNEISSDSLECLRMSSEKPNNHSTLSEEVSCATFPSQQLVRAWGAGACRTTNERKK